MKSIPKTLLACAAASALFLTSCSNDDSENSVSVTYSNYFNRVVDSAGGEFLDKGIKYVITSHYDDQSLSVEIQNFRLQADGQTYTGATVSKMPASGNAWRQGTITSTGSIAITDMTVVPAGAYYIISFHAGTCTVNSVPIAIPLVNKTTTVIPDDGSTNYTNTDDIDYAVVFNPENHTATISVNGPKFSADMPANLILTYPDIPVLFTYDGYSLKADQIIPTYNNTPFPAFTLTDITGQGKFAYPADATLNYHVTGQGSVSTVLALQGTTDSTN